MALLLHHQKHTGRAYFYQEDTSFTVQPTDTQTNAPTKIPTDIPSDIPTDIPSDVPTDIPSDIPTDIPSDIPTDIPSEIPTAAPHLLFCVDNGYYQNNYCQLQYHGCCSIYNLWFYMHNKLCKRNNHRTGH